jgi:hypothetical protein
MQKTLVTTRLRSSIVKTVVRFLLDAVDVLLRYAADDGHTEPAVSNTTTPTDAAAEMAAAVASVAAALHIRNSVTLSGWPAETADALIGAGVSAAAADKMLADALRGRVQ